MAKARKTTKTKTKNKAKATKKPTLLSKIYANRREIEKTMDHLRRTNKKFFGQAVKEVFKKFAELNQFEWDQYTPSWNDGDACRFGTYFESIRINGEEGQSVYELEQILELLSGDLVAKRAELESELKAGKKQDWELNSIKSKLKDLDLDPEEIKRKHLVKKTITDFLEAIDESTFESMFGEGTVTVTREGTNVSDCEHD